MKSFTKKSFTKTYNKINKVNPKTIIQAYEKYGDDMLKIDLENLSKYPKCTYINILIKLPSTGKYERFDIEFVNAKTINNLKDPEDRLWPKVLVKFRSKNDETNEFNDLGKALDCIHKSFIFNVRKLKSEYKIVDPKSDEYDEIYEKNPDVLEFTSVKPSTFYQTKYKDVETQKQVELSNPIINIALKEDTFSKDKSGNVIQSVPYKDGTVTYKDSQDRIKEFNFDVKFLDFYKKSIKDNRVQMEIATVEEMDDDGNMLNVPITNCNVQNFITAGSKLTGLLKLQVIVTSNLFNLTCCFKGDIIVVRSKKTKKSSGDISLDTLNAIAGDLSDDEEEDGDSEELSTTFKGIDLE